MPTNPVYAPGWSNTVRYASIYANGDRIAQVYSGLTYEGNVTFEIPEPLTGRRRGIELDPLGQEVGTYDPGEGSGDVGSYPEQHEFGNVEDVNLGCTLDGITIDCATASRVMNAGATAKRYSIHDRQGWHSEQYPIVPLGMGLFVMEQPYFRDVNDNEGPGRVLDTEEVFFTYQPQTTGQKKQPCPPIPEAPNGVSIDDNIRTAAASFKDALEPKWYAGPDSGEDPFGKLAGHAMWFFNQVKDRGPWDYKYRDPAINEGRRSRYEPLGNFNYGAAGAAAGFSEGQLLRLAGYYQTDRTFAEGENPGMLRSILGVGGTAPYGDEAADKEQIRNGINYYRRKFVLQDCE